jgi:hypothetical protein
MCGDETELGFVDGAGTDARFRHLGGLAMDSLGRILVVDSDSESVRRITIVDSEDGKVQTTVTTITGITGIIEIGYKDDVDPRKARFQLPLGICVDRYDNIFVVDAGNCCIHRIDGCSGAVTTIAKKLGRYDPYSGKTVYETAPVGIVCDPKTALLFFTLRNTIGMISPNGTVESLPISLCKSNPSLTTLRAVVLDSDGDSEWLDAVRSDPNLSRWPAGLMDIVLSFVPCLSLLALETHRVVRVKVFF